MVRKTALPTAANDQVSLFGNWRNAYLAIVVFFLVEVVFFYLAGRYFS